MERQYETPEVVGHIWDYLTETWNGCWQWSGGTDVHGYPRIGLHIPGKRPHPVRSVRPVIYELANGEAFNTNTQRIYNVCGNRMCVRLHPEHNVARDIKSVRAQAFRDELLTAEESV